MRIFPWSFRHFCSCRCVSRTSFFFLFPSLLNSFWNISPAITLTDHAPPPNTPVLFRYPSIRSSSSLVIPGHGQDFCSFSTFGLSTFFPHPIIIKLGVFALAFVAFVFAFDVTLHFLICSRHRVASQTYFIVTLLPHVEWRTTRLSVGLNSTLGSLARSLLYHFSKFFGSNSSSPRLSFSCLSRAAFPDRLLPSPLATFVC